MEELNKYPDFNNYLIFVLTKLTTEGNKNLEFNKNCFALIYLRLSIICVPFQTNLRVRLADWFWRTMSKHTIKI